jgi:hypothetical protein
MNNIKVLYRQADTMSLWGVPYEMKSGQAPRNIIDGNDGRIPGDWIYLGGPGWWGNLSKDRQEEIQAFLEKQDVPQWPCEWSEVDFDAGRSRTEDRR